MRERAENRHQVINQNLNITPGITLNAALNMYKHRLDDHRQGKNSWEGNVSYLYYPEMDEPITAMSRGDFLHSEMLVIMHAVCHMKDSPYLQEEIDLIIDDVYSDINELKRNFHDLSPEEKNAYREKIKNNSISAAEALDENENLDKSAQQLFIKEKIASYPSITKRNEVLIYFYQNAPGEIVITTERCPCNACKKTFTTVAQVIEKHLNFNYLVDMQAKTRKQVAQELENQYDFCKKLYLARNKLVEIELETEFKSYIDQKLAIIKEFNNLSIANPEFTDLIIKEIYYAELQNVKRLKECIEEVDKTYTLSSNKKNIVENLKLALKLCDSQELENQIKSCLASIEKLPQITSYWTQKNDNAVVERHKEVKASLEKIKLTVADLIVKKDSIYNKQVVLAERCLEQAYYPPANAFSSSSISNYSQAIPVTTPNNLDNLSQDKNIDIPGLIYRKIPGDDNCLYNAVGLYLGQDQQMLRNIIAARLEQNKEMQQFINRGNRTVEQYINDIRNSGEWATHVEIEELMQLLDRPIIVLENQGKITNTQDAERFKGDPIFVYYNGSTHYDGLLLNDEYHNRPRELLHGLMQSQQQSPYSISSNSKADNKNFAKQAENKLSKAEKRRMQRARKKEREKELKQEQTHEEQQVIIQRQQDLKAANTRQAQSVEKIEPYQEAQTTNLKLGKK